MLMPGHPMHGTFWDMSALDLLAKSQFLAGETFIESVVSCVLPPYCFSHVSCLDNYYQRLLAL